MNLASQTLHLAHNETTQVNEGNNVPLDTEETAGSPINIFCEEMRIGEEQLTNLKPEIIRVLARERLVCETALARLRDRYRPLEQQYGWTTDEFLKKFSAGEIGDNQELFLWYALTQAAKDWQATRNSLEELLASSERVGA